jgi:hypothetical protein
MDPMQTFRAPIVTATGVLLGFYFHLSAGWASRAFTDDRLSHYAILASICVNIPLHIVVLYRSLRMNYPAHDVSRYYARTLALFVTGLVVTFCTILAAVGENYTRHRT